jgi:hypothetical protein
MEPATLSAQNKADGVGEILASQPTPYHALLWEVLLFAWSGDGPSGLNSLQAKGTLSPVRKKAGGGGVVCQVLDQRPKFKANTPLPPLDCTQETRVGNLRPPYAERRGGFLSLSRTTHSGASSATGLRQM